MIVGVVASLTSFASTACRSSSFPYTRYVNDASHAGGCLAKSYKTSACSASEASQSYCSSASKVTFCLPANRASESARGSVYTNVSAASASDLAGIIRTSRRY